jgi:hypothetical protein
MSPGQLLILSAPSGAGKTTLVRRLMAQLPGLAFSISATTRAPRGSEEDEVDYHFLTTEDFRARIDRGEFLEWEEVYPGRYYGTLRSEVERLWAEGKVVAFDIDVVGGRNLNLCTLALRFQGSIAALGHNVLRLFPLPGSAVASAAVAPPGCPSSEPRTTRTCSPCGTARTSIRHVRRGSLRAATTNSVSSWPAGAAGDNCFKAAKAAPASSPAKEQVEPSSRSRPTRVTV